MEKSFHEIHNHINKEHPITFHIDSVKGNIFSRPNWHENIEILCMIEGNATVRVDSASMNVTVGDIIVVNCNSVHTIRGHGAGAKYYCLIIDNDYCKALGFDTDNNYLNSKIYDMEIAEMFRGIAAELYGKEKYYEAAVKQLVCRMLVKMYRLYYNPLGHINDNAGKSEIVKKACKYINSNYTHSITIDEIAEAVNVSKYYLCRIFKEFTDLTMIEYINFRRCRKASMLLDSSDTSISDIAEICGFENMSYFSKIYKKYMNILPSQQKKNRKAVQ